MPISFRKRQPTDVSLTKRADRRNVFRIERFKNDHGFQTYALENTAEGRRIFVPRFVFGRFRACVRQILEEEIARDSPEPFERTVSFLNRDYYYFKSSAPDIENLIIQDLEEQEGSSGYITVGRRGVRTLDQLLYSGPLQHPSDVLEEIIAYHKLFQFSFVKGSRSITSNLILRKDVLQSIERYTPKLAQKIVLDGQPEGEEPKQRPGRALERKAGANLYKPRLGERFHDKDIRVDYEEIFAGARVSLASAAGSGERAETDRRSKGLLSHFPIPLAAPEVKAFETGRFYFELSPEEASELREKFLSDRSAEFFLGFEIVDALFTDNRRIRTFRFPLYYTRVGIRESGRGVYLESRRDGLFHLNYLALAHLVERFNQAPAGTDAVESFFRTLLVQDVSVDRRNDRIYASRYLPVKEAVFDRTREILFGYQDENGKGGLLADLTVKGIECDLQSVCLYRAPRLLNPLDQALELDLDQINAIAHRSSDRFYTSLLGRFLTPEQQREKAGNGDFGRTLWMPGALPQSTRALVEKLDRHDIVLLEGPPGTGKTFTIMNLLLHCINSRKRVLIVSDQQAAVEALVEKLEEYLVGDDRGTPAERKWKDLLTSAVKVVDTVETGDQSLADLVASLAGTFRVHEPEPGAGARGANLEKELGQLGARIEKLKAGIARKMLEQLGGEVPFDHRVPGKGDGRTDLESLLGFLGIVLGGNAEHRAVIDAFIGNRSSLARDGMEDCYGYFKVPARSFGDELKALRDDGKMLARLVQQRPRTPDELKALTLGCPQNEIVRHLEGIMRAYAAASRGNGPIGWIRRIRAAFKPPLQARARTLERMIADQVELLKIAEGLSPGLLALLRELHEAIGVGEPHRALGLWRSLSTRSGIDRVLTSSIQGDLEQMEKLFVQHDRVVRRRLVASLGEIVHAAVGSRRSSGTSNLTSIMALADHLKQFNSVADSGAVFEELRRKLFETFPVWVVRKQVVPFLLPCTEQSFDLVVVDEATQCRVDDSLPLMFRAKKILVVGDDRQTVLQKDSVIDDYLFADHELDEHLRSTQARGFKGGGSHIFALVKAIKEASVLLDEHYRCPADIIEFSNRHVYDGRLNVMQWSLPEQPPAAVVVTDRDPGGRGSGRAASGRFKGIDTGMVDRFMEYVVRTLREIERSTGRKINPETDVALCYFLLKNEPYVKFVKSRYLGKLGSAEDVLDGAGAALQGKERDYVFYLWDVTRYNIGAFRQGDDADKRKGELNVLMSRPKKKALHFLHRDFDQLDHGRTSITSYLWRTLQRRREDGHRSDDEAGALQGSLLGRLFELALEHSGKRGLEDVRRSIADETIDFRAGIAVGDSGRVVDLIAFPRGDAREVVGLVDLSGFGSEADVGAKVVDYYFQLKRVSPRIDPVFAFPHELLDENGQTFGLLVEKLGHLDVAGLAPRPRARRIRAIGAGT